MTRIGAAILVLFLPACAHRADDTAPVEVPQAVAPPPPPDAAPPPPPGDAPVLPPANYEIRVGNECPGKAVHVDFAKVEGNQLYVDVGASGCSAPEILACWNRRIMTSKPPRMEIEIHQSDTGDCEQLIRSSERFDLTPLVAQSDYETIIFHVGDLVAGWQR